MQEPKASSTIRQREADLSDDATTISRPNLTSWPTETQGIMHEPRTWIGVSVGLIVLICFTVLGYQFWAGSKERRKRRDEEGIELSSIPRPNSFMKFKQRKERRAAEQRGRREQERIIRSSGGVHAPGVIVTERQLYDLERSHEDLLDETRWLSLRDTDCPLVRLRSDLDSRRPTVIHFCHGSDDSGTGRHLVGHSPFEPASDESRSRVSRPPPSYGSQRRSRF